MWSAHAGDVTMLFGTHYQEGEKLYNCAYVLKDLSVGVLTQESRIIKCYVKSKLLPFFETFIETNSLLHSCHQIFLNGKNSFSCGPAIQPLYELPVLGRTAVRICSELLWNMPKKNESDVVILLVNDSYYRFNYYKALFKLFATIQAVRAGQKFVYCGWDE